MKTIKQFEIPFASLKIGRHDFKFEIDSAFFAHFDYSLLKSGQLTLDLEFDKQLDSLFLLRFSIAGTVDLTCERCLDTFEYPLDIQEKLIVKLGDESFDDPEILVIARNEHSLDVAPLVFEFICLALPLILQHDADESGEPSCNNDTARVLKELQNLNEAPKDITDPRWEILNKLKNN